jgi:ADP-ribosylglycohydrolase
MSDLKDKIKGLIYGQCLGDAVGLQTEFKFKRDNHKIVFPYTEPIGSFISCDWTDDSDHMILVMQSNFNVADFVVRLKDWVEHGFSECGDSYGIGLGGSMSMVIRDENFVSNPIEVSKKIWNESGRKLAANGSLMRTAIVSSIADTDEMLTKSRELCLVTHYDTRCVAACAMLNYIIHEILYSDTIDTDKLFIQGVKIAAKYLRNDEKPILISGTRRQPTPDYYFDDKFKSRIEELIYYVRAGYSDIKLLELDKPGTIGYVFKCLGSAMYALKNINGDFKSTIVSIVSECGDADTNAAVVGALLGAYCGYSKLPLDWLEALPHKKWLDSIVDKFISKLT